MKRKADALDQALRQLLADLAKGKEYPDAHSSAVLRFHVDGDELRDMYDDLCNAR